MNSTKSIQLSSRSLPLRTPYGARLNERIATCIVQALAFSGYLWGFYVVGTVAITGHDCHVDLLLLNQS